MNRPANANSRNGPTIISDRLVVRRDDHPRGQKLRRPVPGRKQISKNPGAALARDQQREAGRSNCHRLQFHLRHHVGVKHPAFFDARIDGREDERRERQRRDHVVEDDHVAEHRERPDDQHVVGPSDQVGAQHARGQAGDDVLENSERRAADRDSGRGRSIPRLCTESIRRPGSRRIRRCRPATRRRKKSPIMFPIAEPHAAAGPNRNEHTTGIALAGRSSVTPGISGTTLNGTSTAA